MYRIFDGFSPTSPVTQTNFDGFPTSRFEVTLYLYVSYLFEEVCANINMSRFVICMGSAARGPD